MNNRMLSLYTFKKVLSKALTIQIQDKSGETIRLFAPSESREIGRNNSYLFKKLIALYIVWRFVVF